MLPSRELDILTELEARIVISLLSSLPNSTSSENESVLSYRSHRSARPCPPSKLLVKSGHSLVILQVRTDDRTASSFVLLDETELLCS